MIVLVLNLGTTSFKYKLFDMAAEERVLAQGAADRIGQEISHWHATLDGGRQISGHAALPDHAAALEMHLQQLVKANIIADIHAVNALGFKAVHGGPIEGAVQVDDKVLRTMEDFSDVAPLHNPPYITAMRGMMAQHPQIPQVAAFETGFHQTIPIQRQVYAIPHAWTERLGIRRYGFHGASHRYIAGRMKELAPTHRRLISLHLGGSCSICAIKDGKSVANSFGMTLQTGIPHAARSGDFDGFAIMKLLKNGIPLDSVWKSLGTEGGLLGMTGMKDMRDIEAKAATGDARSALAIDIFVESCRHYLGAYLAVLGGTDAICFTGGIGQNSPRIRAAILDNMTFANIQLNPRTNAAVHPNTESRIDSGDNSIPIWVLPTNEELIVARQTVAVLDQSRAHNSNLTNQQSH